MKDYNILVFILSMIINVLIIKVSKKYHVFMDPLSDIKVQSFHKNLTPRAGGISIYLLSLIFTYFISQTFFLLILAFLPSFVYGVYEDIDGNTPHKIRLLVMSISTFLATIMTGLTVKSIGFIAIPEILQISFSVFSVIGLASAINFIDGLNGLASGITTIGFLFLGFAALISGNYDLAVTMFLFSSLILGFFVINFPLGKIFLGDAGAYFLGYLIALSSESLVFNNTNISPWFPVALLGYPIIETLFTIHRRYKRLTDKGIDFFTEERVHLHSLLYLKVFKNNSLASSLIISTFMINALISFQFRSSDIICATIFILESIIYLFVYQNIVNFKMGKFVAYLNKFVKLDQENISTIKNNSNISNSSDFFKNEEKILAVNDLVD